MNDAEYYAAQVPEPWTILGLELLPLSAGHIILLNRIESPFVCGDPVEWEDLACAVFICSRTFEGAMASFAAMEALEEWATEWHRKLIVEQGPEIDFPKKVEEFNAYLKEGTKHPDYVATGGSSVGDVAAIQFVKTTLMAETGISETQFLNQAWRISMLDFLTSCARKGQLQIVESDAMEEAFEAGKKLMEAFKAGKIKAPCPR